MSHNGILSLWFLKSFITAGQGPVGQLDFKAACNLLPVVDLSLVLQARWDPGTELMFSLAEREDGTLQLRVYTLGI